jgi:hypothetical protein
MIATYTTTPDHHQAERERRCDELMDQLLAAMLVSVPVNGIGQPAGPGVIEWCVPVVEAPDFFVEEGAA